MTEENPSDFDAQAEYLNESALLPVREFTTTMKQGYIEEEVDLWREEAYAHVRDLVNRYNALAYKAGMAVEDANARAVAAEEQVADLTALLAEANDARDAAEKALAEAPVYTTPEPVVEDEVVEYSYEEEEQPEVEEEFPEPVVEEEIIVEETVVVVSPTLQASERAQQILTAAAEEATEHVSRALDRVAKVEAEAQAEAEELVASATVEAAEIIATATEEASNLKANAVNDAADALEQLDTIKAETRALFERVTLFHQASLEQSQALLGTVTPEEVAGEVELLEGDPEEEVTEIVNNDEETVTDFDEEPEETDFSEEDLAELDGAVVADFDEEDTDSDPAEDLSYEVDLDSDESDNGDYSYDTEEVTVDEEPAEVEELPETTENPEVEGFDVDEEDNNYNY